MQKARGHAARRHRPPTARRHGVSGSVSSPDRGSSHRSVALLGSLSVVIEYLALRDGPRRFRPGFTCPTLLGYRRGEFASSPTGLSPALAPLSSGLRLRSLIPCHRPHDPAWCPTRFRLVPVRSPLLRESRLLSVPPGTEMFQFPGSHGHSGIDARWAAPPDFSQPSTPESLMTPRHPPRALRSLTTPTRPPRLPEGEARRPDLRGVSPRSHSSIESRSVLRRGPPSHLGNDPHCGAGRFTASEYPRIRKGPAVLWRD